jgi:hypothetical protein
MIIYPEENTRRVLLATGGKLAGLRIEARGWRWFTSP